MPKSTHYRPPEFANPIQLQLSRNETEAVIDDLDDQLRSLEHRFVSRYPAHVALQDQIAKQIGVDSERVVVTAGGDDSIDRVMRTSINPSRQTIVTHAPSFEMVQIYCGNYGGQLKTVEWLEGEFPVDELVAKIDAQTALVVLTSPNNPTGGMISTEVIFRVNKAARAVGAKVLIDHAYIEFADTDPTDQFVADDNLMMVRTFSKAWGLAGLRVGYLVAPTAEYASIIRNTAGPFPVSAVSLELARRALTGYRPQMQSNVAAVKTIRRLLTGLIESCGGKPFLSQGNFVLAEFANAEAIWEGLSDRGIAVRKFPGAPLLANRLRFSCPVRPADFLQLAKILCQITNTDFEPQKSSLGQAFEPDHCLEPTSDALPTELPDSQSEPAAADLLDRVWSLQRKTKETEIDLKLNLDGSGKIEIATGIGFLDHMLTALAFHAGLDLTLTCRGDLHVDDHHTAEDCALALGAAIDGALGRRTGIRRFGYAYAPLDEALARTVIDLSGRPWPEIHLNLEREMIGTWACENVTHFFQSLAMTLKCALHVDVLRGANDHHRVEAAFKSLAKALREALTRATGEVPSTKGVL